MQPTSLLPAVDDPLVVSSFQSVYSFSLGLAARYDDALRVSEEFLATSQAYRLDFATSYALASTAVASSGAPKVARSERLREQGARAVA